MKDTELIQYGARHVCYAEFSFASLSQSPHNIHYVDFERAKRERIPHNDGTWCWARVDGPKGTPRTGKWMLWPIGEEALEVWRIICQLTSAGELGIQAKISCREQRELAGERLICVYTADSDDLPDLQRVVNMLRSQLDPKHRLIYKEDSMTRAGFYQDADRRVSKWYVRPGETIIRAVKGYRPAQEGNSEEYGRRI